jgi:hypothetical protein
VAFVNILVEIIWERCAFKFSSYCPVALPHELCRCLRLPVPREDALLVASDSSISWDISKKLNIYIRVYGYVILYMIWSSAFHMIEHKGNIKFLTKFNIRFWATLSRNTLYPQKLAPTSPASGGRSVGIVSQPLTEMNTRNIKILFLGRKVRLVRRADNLTAIYKPIV